MTVRTRYAPSPTGFMHVGNLRTALYEYLIAKSQDGSFVLRIEDTDQKREVEGAVEILLSSLKRYNIIFDEGATADGEVGNYGPYYHTAKTQWCNKSDSIQISGAPPFDLCCLC